MTNGSLMKVESIAECSPWRILQYFWPALSDNWFWKSISCLYEGGRFTRLLYTVPGGGGGVLWNLYTYVGSGYSFGVQNFEFQYLGVFKTINIF